MRDLWALAHGVRRLVMLVEASIIHFALCRVYAGVDAAQAAHPFIRQELLAGHSFTLSNEIRNLLLVSTHQQLIGTERGGLACVDSRGCVCVFSETAVTHTPLPAHT